MVFRNAREGDKGEECTGSVRGTTEKRGGETGFQEDTGRHGGREGLATSARMITC